VHRDDREPIDAYRVSRKEWREYNRNYNCQYPARKARERDDGK
jgi:hypothetical protein